MKIKLIITLVIIFVVANIGLKLYPKNNKEETITKTAIFKTQLGKLHLKSIDVESASKEITYMGIVKNKKEDNKARVFVSLRNEAGAEQWYGSGIVDMNKKGPQSIILMPSKESLTLIYAMLIGLSIFIFGTIFIRPSSPAQKHFIANSSVDYDHKQQQMKEGIEEQPIEELSTNNLAIEEYIKEE